MDLGTDKVLVSGAAGWLGRALLQALSRGLPDFAGLGQADAKIKIRAFMLAADKAPAEFEGGRIDVYRGDLRVADDCRLFSKGAHGALLIHAAGVIHPARVQDFYEINLQGTLNLLQAAARQKVSRAVVVSSNSPLGVNPHPDHLFDEDSPYNPYMNYGRSKMLMEQAVKKLGEETGLPVTIIRPPWFYGPFQPDRQTLFYKMIRDGKAPIVGDGKNLRSMSYIDNLCAGILLAARTPQSAGQTYWIADERPYSMNEIIDTIESLLENEFAQTCAHKRLRLPSLASEVALGVDFALQSIGMYNQKIHVLSEMNKTIACAIDKAKRELGYQPAISLEEGMRRSLRYCREKGWL